MASHALRVTGKILLGLMAVVVAIPVMAVIVIGTPYFSAKVGTLITHRSGRNVSLEGKIETHLWSREPRFVITGVKVGNAQWSDDPTMFEAKRIEFSIRPWELLRARLVIPELTIDQPHIVLEKNLKGEANWNFSQNPQAAVLKQPVPSSRSSFPVIEALKINDGSLTYRDPAQHILTKVDISTISGESGKEESLHVHGKGDYQKQTFMIDVTGASVLQLRDSKKPYPFALKTIVGGTSAEVEGTVDDPVKMHVFDVTLTLKGANAADLFPLTGIALPPTPPYQLSGHLTRQDDLWHFEKFTGKLGNSDLKGDVTWHPVQKTPYFEGVFVSDNLDMADLSGLVGAHKKPVDDSRVIPDAPLDISRLLAMNADVDFHGKHIKSPQLLDDFAMKIHLKDGVLELKPVSFGIAGGQIITNLTIQGRENPPVATMDVSFKKLSLGAFFQPLADKFGKDNVSAGTLGGKAKLKGTGKSLRDILATSDGDIGIGMQGGELSHLLLELAGLDLFRSAGLILTDSDEPVPMHCLIAHFTVNSGMMQTNEVLIDTDVTAIRANGGINLKDETIDMHVHTSPKEASLFSAHSPIDITGTLKKPKIGVNTAALVARGGVATALGLLAPPAALIAFIEPGLGDDGNCAAFIARLKQSSHVTVPKAAVK